MARARHRREPTGDMDPVRRGHALQKPLVAFRGIRRVLTPPLTVTAAQDHLLKSIKYGIVQLRPPCGFLILRHRKFSKVTVYFNGFDGTCPDRWVHLRIHRDSLILFAFDEQDLPTDYGQSCCFFEASWIFI